MRAALLTLAFTALAAAADDATTTVGFFGGGKWENTNDDESAPTIPFYTSVAASVVDVNAVETVLAISCLEGAATESCSIKDPWTMTQGISSFSWYAEYTAFNRNPPVTATLDYNCAYQNYTLSATCTYSMSYSGSSDGAETSTSYSTETSWPSVSTYAALEVTGGVEKFNEPEATETPEGGAGFAGPMQAMVTAAPVLAAGLLGML